MIPEGKYNARAKTWDFGETNNGKPQVAVEFQIVDGPQQGQSINWYGMFEKAVSHTTGEPIDMAKRTIESLRYCGWVGNDISELDGVEKNIVQIVVKHNTYQGQTRAQVSFVNRLGGALVKNKLEGAKRTALATRLKGLAMSVSVDLAAPGASPIPNGAGDHDDPPDDYDDYTDPI